MTARPADGAKPGEAVQANRRCKPGIAADAAHAILIRNSHSCTGNFFLGEEVLSEAGITDFSGYAVKPGTVLMPDLFVA